MRKIKVLALVTVITMVSVDAFGGDWFKSWRERRQQRQVQQTAQKQKTDEPVGAPIDGGLLALLGAAGVAYYGVRKKKKNSIAK